MWHISLNIVEKDLYTISHTASSLINKLKVKELISLHTELCARHESVQTVIGISLTIFITTLPVVCNC